MRTRYHTVVLDNDDTDDADDDDDDNHITGRVYIHKIGHTHAHIHRRTVSVEGQWWFMKSSEQPTIQYWLLKRSTNSDDYRPWVGLSRSSAINSKLSGRGAFLRLVFIQFQNGLPLITHKRFPPTVHCCWNESPLVRFGRYRAVTCNFVQSAAATEESVCHPRWLRQQGGITPQNWQIAHWRKKQRTERFDRWRLWDYNKTWSGRSLWHLHHLFKKAWFCKSLRCMVRNFRDIYNWFMSRRYLHTLQIFVAWMLFLCLPT